MERPGLIIRADGSALIGMGHLTRCAALAGGLLRAGWRVAFVSRKLDGMASRVTGDAGCSLIEVPDQLTETEDARLVCEAAELAGYRMVLVDHYDLGQEWWSRVSGETALAAIDDLGRPDLGPAVDLVVNQNAGAEESWYRGARRVLCGPEFVLLREAFHGRRTERKESLQDTERIPCRLLITLGGGHPGAVLEKILEALRLVDCPVTAEVVIGPGGDEPKYETVGDELAGRVTFHRSPDRIDLLMARSDLALTGGGTTVYECAFLGLPALTIQLAENQRRVCREMMRLGTSVFLGTAESVESGMIAEQITVLAGDRLRRRAMAEAGMERIDGRGVERVMRVLNGMWERCAGGAPH